MALMTRKEVYHAKATVQAPCFSKNALPLEERKQLLPAQLAPDHNLPCAIHRVDLED